MYCCTAGHSQANCRKWLAVAGKVGGAAAAGGGGGGAGYKQHKGYKHKQQANKSENSN
jgi:hypothetical protein